MRAMTKVGFSGRALDIARLVKPASYEAFCVFIAEGFLGHDAAIHVLVEELGAVLIKVRVPVFPKMRGVEEPLGHRGLRPAAVATVADLLIPKLGPLTTVIVPLTPCLVVAATAESIAHRGAIPSILCWVDSTALVALGVKALDGSATPPIVSPVVERILARARHDGLTCVRAAELSH